MLRRAVARRPLQIFGMIAIVCVTLAGLTSILERHAEQAESYPAFSSFRTLPEGTSVLYEALRRTPVKESSMTAERNTQPLGAVRYDHAAILILGVQLYSVNGNGQWFNDMEELAGRGNRVIIGLVPHRNRFIQAEDDKQLESLKRWSIRLAFVREIDFSDEEAQLVTGWPMYFAQSNGWIASRAEGGKPVVIERPQGKGTIVLLANAYLLTNAAMVDDRQTRFLASLIGPVHQTIFDETHFGIEETGSIAALARRYRLQGLILGLVITASLFIWKSAAGFPPSLFGGLKPGQSLLGEDSSEAFRNLLRRNIKPEDILATCVEAWGKMYHRTAGAALPAAIDLAESGSKTPVQTYARIQQILSQTGRLRPDGAKPNPS